RTFEVDDDAQESPIGNRWIGAIGNGLRRSEGRAVCAARHRDRERRITAHLRGPTNATPFSAGDSAVENSGPRAAGGNTRQRTAGHVAVVVEIAAEISRGEIDRTHMRDTVRTKRSKIGIDTRNCPAVMVCRPDLTRAVDRHTRRSTLHRDRADVSAVVLEMAHRAAIQRVRHPHFIFLVDDAALRKRIALVENSEQRAIRRKLTNLTVAKRRVPDVAATIDTQAVARMIEAGPVAAARARQRFRRVPAKHRVRRPDHAVLIDQAAIAAETNCGLSTLDLARDAVEQIETTTTRAAYPNVVVLGDRHVARAKRVDLRVMDDALVRRRGDAAIRVRAIEIGPRLNVTEAR